MKPVISIMAAALSFVSPLWAGSMESPVYATPQITTPISVSFGTDWGGFYAGGLASLDRGDQTYFAGGVFSNGPWDLEGNTYGAFAGYNFQNDLFVYGLEAAYVAGAITSAVPTTPEVEYSSIIDVKARAGYAVGSALIYGVAGGSIAKWEDPAGIPETISTTGFNYGIGVDLQVTDRVFIGAEYLIRDLSGDFVSTVDTSIETTTKSAQIRIGMRF